MPTQTYASPPVVNPPPQVVEIKLDEAPLLQDRRIVEAKPEEEEESAEEEEEDWEVCPVNPRKRSSNDLDEEEEADSRSEQFDEEALTLRKRRSGSFSKRLRLEEDYIKDAPAAPPTKLRKRSSEDLDNESVDGGYEAPGRESAAKKKLRIRSTPNEDASTSPPLSITDSHTPTGDEDDLDLSSLRNDKSVFAYAQHPRGLRGVTPVALSEAEMDKLYSFGSPGAIRDSEVDA